MINESFIIMPETSEIPERPNISLSDLMCSAQFLIAYVKHCNILKQFKSLIKASATYSYTPLYFSLLSIQ